MNINTDKSSKIHFSNVELNLFYNQISDIIYLAPVIGADNKNAYKYINISNYNTLGGQIAFKYSFYPNFDFGLGFGLTGVFASFDKKNDNLSKYNYSKDASLNASYTFPRVNIKLSTSYKYTGKSSNVFVNDKDQIEYGSIDSYHTLDFTLNKKFFDNKLTVSLGVKNLFNNTIIVSKGVTGDTPHSSGDGRPVGYGRLFFTSISYNVFK